MINVCKKLSSNFFLTWDPEIITKNFNCISDPNDNVYSLPDGSPHWQIFFKQNAMFSRNFHINFKSECEEVIEKLEILRSSISSKKDTSLGCFLRGKLSSENISIIKTIPGKNINLHKDRMRTFCINIGLKNSNKWKTFISKSSELDNFYNNETISFKIEDGDVYYLLIKNPHYVECLDPNNLLESRYILSYTCC